MEAQMAAWRGARGLAWKLPKGVAAPTGRWAAPKSIKKGAAPGQWRQFGRILGWERRTVAVFSFGTLVY